MTAAFSHLDVLESEAIHIFREAAAQFRSIFVLLSGQGGILIPA